MRVLMIQALSVESSSKERVYPIGLVALAGVLNKEGHDVAVLDMNIEADPFGALKAMIARFRPEAVGISLRNIDPLGNKTDSFVHPFVAAVKMVALLAPEAWIISGGTAFCLFPGRLMQEAPEIHYGIVGEAEASLPLLLGSLESPAKVGGLCYRDGGEIAITPPAAALDMSGYVPPSREILRPDRYVDINSYVPAVGIESKRGCPLRCSYCVYPRLQGSALRCREPGSVVDEMEVLAGEYGIERFHFTDAVLNMPRGHLEEICTEILRRKLHVRWDGFLREDALDEKSVALYERAGCECFSFSPDGLSQLALDALQKGLAEDDVMRAAELASGTDVTTVYHFLVNVPGETESSADRGMRTLEKIYKLHRRNRNLGAVVLNNIRILPGTAVEAQAVERKVIGPGTDLLYPVYYNPPPFESLRYRLETFSTTENVMMWQGLKI